MWGYMPCNKLSIGEVYHDDLERAKLEEEGKAQSAGQMANEKWDAWNDYDGCVCQIHIEVAICVVTETALRLWPYRKRKLKEQSGFRESSLQCT